MLQKCARKKSWTLRSHFLVHILTPAQQRNTRKKMVKFNRESEEEVSTFMDQLRSKCVIKKPITCKIVFRNRVDLDYLSELQARTPWRLLFVGEKEVLVYSNREPATPLNLLIIINLSKEFNDCCRMISLNR